MTYAILQRALRDRGRDPGPVDGVPGPRTRAALAAFQADAGLPATGLADRATLARLALRPALPPPWLAVALALRGVAERPGAGSNPTILRWAAALPAWSRAVYGDDSTPWCGLFVAHAVATALPDEPLPANPLAALGWARFGVPLARPAPGAVLVFRRRGGGHVGFYLGERADALRVLGGNQGDRVSEAWIARGRHVATRWPATALPPASGPVLLAGSGSLSRNES